MKYDFFDAYRESVKNSRRMRYDGGDWGYVDDLMLVKEAMVEKKWEMEPAPEKLFTFLEALELAFRGRKIDLYPTENWSEYITVFDGLVDGGRAILRDLDGKDWWPTLEQQRAKKWRVEPAEEEDKEVVVWVLQNETCGKENLHVFPLKPVLKDFPGGDAWVVDGNDDDNYMIITHPSKTILKGYDGEPQKCILKPANSDDKRDYIKLSGAEMQSGSSRVKWAEGLVLQLPSDHDGRNSWLLNYGRGEEAQALRNAHKDLPVWDDETDSLGTNRGLI